MKNTRLTISFYVRKMNDPLKGKIYCRLTVNGFPKDFSTGSVCVLSKWDAKRYKVTGTSEVAISINNYLTAIEIRLQNIMTSLTSAGKIITTHTVYNKFTLTDELKHTVISSFKYHNEEMVKLVKKGVYASETLVRYETTMRHVQQFMQVEYRVDDKPLVELDMQFINRFYLFLRTVRNCNNNSTTKYIENFRKIIRIAVEYNWLEKNPFLSYRKRLEEVEKEPLTWSELQRLKEKIFDIDRLERVRDVFLFACFTGYAYTDLAKLTQDNIIKDDQGYLWIKTLRTKTRVAENVPLFNEAEQIIEKYCTDPECLIKGLLVPVLSNQKYNSYLKEIADLCGIKKPLTTHIARHTFGTLMQDIGVSREAVQKMMGHKRISQTQMYSKTNDNTRVINEVKPFLGIAL